MPVCTPRPISCAGHRAAVAITVWEQGRQSLVRTPRLSGRPRPSRALAAPAPVGSLASGPASPASSPSSTANGADRAARRSRRGCSGACMPSGASAPARRPSRRRRHRHGRPAASRLRLRPGRPPRVRACAAAPGGGRQVGAEVFGRGEGERRCIARGSVVLLTALPNGRGGDLPHMGWTLTPGGRRSTGTRTAPSRSSSSRASSPSCARRKSSASVRKASSSCRAASRARPRIPASDRRACSSSTRRR